MYSAAGLVYDLDSTLGLPNIDSSQEPNRRINLSQQYPKWLRRLPNQLTVLRILCIPLVVWLMIQGGHNESNGIYQPTVYDGWASAIFAVAAITDFFDGWLARRFKVETLLGKLLDPLADKLLVVSALIILVDKHRMAGWIAVVLIVRDLGINAVRIAALEENIDVASSWIGKTKTLLLDFGIAFLAVNGEAWGFLPCRPIGLAFLWTALFASVVSAIQYLVGYARQSKNLSLDL